MSIWEEPGLLVKGHDHPPTVMMGHHRPQYQDWIEAAGYAAAKLLQTYELDITIEYPPLIQRIIQSGVERVVCGTLDPNPLVSGSGRDAASGSGRRHTQLANATASIATGTADLAILKHPSCIVLRGQVV